MIQRFFAWGINQVMRIYEPKIAPRKQSLFGGLTGKVVEIGPGTGPNFKYFNPSVKWTGIEPNPHMRKYLEAEAERVGVDAELLEGSAMRLPFEDASVDCVVGTLVLCSVPCPATVLAEVRRVLKPGGRYLFVEHVEARAGSWHRFIQRAFKPLWCCCADGCHVDRRSWETIRAAGFEKSEIEHFNLNFPIVTPHIMGSATR